MKVVLDYQACQSASRYRGIGRGSRSLMISMALELISRGHEIVFLLNGSFQDTLDTIKVDIADQLPAANFKVFHIPTPCASFCIDNNWRQMAARFLREHAIACLEPDFVHVPALLADGWGDDSVASVGLLGNHIPVSLTQHDLIPLVMADHYMHSSEFREYYMEKLENVKRADLLFAISKYSQQEAIEWMGVKSENIIHISSASDKLFTNDNIDRISSNESLQELGVRKGFYLYAPGGFDYRKNVDKLFEAYAKLDAEVRVQHQLVIASSLEPGQREILSQSIKKVGMSSNDILLTDYVSDKVLMQLYSSCFAYVFPSLHEGFGLPALEAMACGAPVIASNCTSIPEVLGISEALFDPYDSNSIADRLLQLHTDENYRERLITHSKTRPSLFSWEYSAKVAIDAMIERNRKLVANGWKVTSKSDLPSCNDLLEKIQLLLPNIKPSSDDLKAFHMCYEHNQRLM